MPKVSRVVTLDLRERQLICRGDKAVAQPVLSLPMPGVAGNLIVTLHTAEFLP